MKQPGELINEGERLLLEGKSEESVGILSQALNENPSLRRGYLLRARAYEFLGNTIGQPNRVKGSAAAWP